MSERPKFNIGDTVYVAWAHGFADNYVPCPICFGKLSVVLILGNGEHQPIECDACGKGYEGPQGVVNERAVKSGKCAAEVKGISASRDDGWQYETDAHWHHDRADVFATEAEAEARREVLHAEAEAGRVRSFEAQFKGTKRKGAWTAKYHREQIRDLEEKIAWHKKRLAQ